MQEKIKDDTISRLAAIDALDGVKVNEEYCPEYDIGYNDGIDFAVSRLSVLPSAQPELIEKAAYIRGFEQGRTQGMIDSQGGKK